MTAIIRCESCVESLFYRGSGACPKCQKILKKNDFRELVFEDTYIEKEVQIRKKYIKEQDLFSLIREISIDK